jgi:hypothetical protein
MEVIDLEANGKSAGKYDEKKFLSLVKKALEQGQKTGKTGGYPLADFVKEVYTGESPNMGALRKKAQEIGWKHNIGDVRVIIKEKGVEKPVIGFSLKK